MGAAAAGAAAGAKPVHGASESGTEGALVVVDADAGDEATGATGDDEEDGVDEEGNAENAEMEDSEGGGAV